MIKVGDKVKFLNDVGGGVVTGFINKKTVNVENEDGFEIPYPIAELLNTSAPELNIGAPKANIIEPEAKPEATPEINQSSGEIVSGKDAPDFYFCFVPTDSKNPLSGEIELYLLNDSNFTLLYNYANFSNKGMENKGHGTVAANAKLHIDSLVQSDLTELPDFGFQIIYFKNDGLDWNEPFSKKFKINPVKFYKESTFRSNSYFDKNALVLKINRSIIDTDLDKLSQDDFKKVVKSKEARTTTIKKPKKQNTEIIEIDLHINELLDNSEGLSNREILEIQLDKVESEMKLALRSNAKKIVFIHGVGQGVLKQEVSKLLNSKFKKYHYYDASFKEYGYGATMVNLKK